jgi:hypothetical protein
MNDTLTQLNSEIAKAGSNVGGIEILFSNTFINTVLCIGIGIPIFLMIAYAISYRNLSEQNRILKIRLISYINILWSVLALFGFMFIAEYLMLAKVVGIFRLVLGLGFVLSYLTFLIVLRKNKHLYNFLVLRKRKVKK